jgi:hypothetical protein
VIFLFLSVAAVCISAIVGFRMHLTARPTISVAAFEALSAKTDRLEQRINKTNMNTMGRGAV